MQIINNICIYAKFFVPLRPQIVNRQSSNRKSLYG